MKSVFLGCWRGLRSRKLAVALISLLLVACVAGTVVPQKGEDRYGEWRRGSPRIARFVEYLGLDRVFISVPFIALVALVALSTLACTASRSAKLKGSRSGSGAPASLLSRRRLLGSVLFHCGVLVALAGGVVSSLTRFEGRMVVTEGQVRPLDESSFLDFGRRGPLATMSHPFAVRLAKFRPIHETRWGIPHYESDLVVVEGGREQEKATVSVNHPFSFRGVSFYQGEHGFSPRFMLAERKTGTMFESYVVFKTDLDADPVRYLDSFPVPGTDIVVDAEFFPDAVLEGKVLRSKSPVPENPAVSVAVRRGAKVIFAGPMFRTGPIELEDGMWFGLAGVKYWSELIVAKDSGVDVLFVGSWIAVAGLCVRFLPRRRRKAPEEG